MPNHRTRDDIDLVDGSFYVDDPHEKYTWMREHAPVYFDARNGVWGIASYAALLAMEKDPGTFSNAGGIRPDGGPIAMMIDMDDPEHWKRRKLVNKGFTPRRVRDSEQKIRDVCDAIIDQVCERGECDFVSEVAAPLPMILIGDMLGVAPDDHDRLLRWSDDLLRGLGTRDSEKLATQARAGLEERRDRAHRLTEQLALALALRVAVFEVLLPGTRPGDDLEGRVGNVVADLAADRDLGAPVDLHVLDEVLVLLGQELGQRFRRLVEMVIRVKDWKRDVLPVRQLPHEILLRNF